MKNCSFIKTPEEIEYFKNFGKEGVKFENHEGMYVAWMTKPEIVHKLVPAPLEPVAPIVIAYTAYFYENNFWKDYNEGGLFIPVKYKDIYSLYCLAMPIAGKNDIPIFFGREGLGFPKKNADELAVVRRGDDINVWIKRNGIRFFEVEGEIGDFNNPEAEGIFAGFKSGSEAPFNAINFKYNINMNNEGTPFKNVQLVESLNTSQFYSVEKVNVKNITLNPSMDDPWAELEVVQPLGAVYCKYGVVMEKSRIIAELDGEEAAPYLFARWDASMVGHIYRNFVINK